jgi:hypothetical protein
LNTQGKAELEHLLELSAALDRSRIANGPTAAVLAVIVAGLVRCRRLARAARLLLDHDLQLEAEIVVRSLMETAVGVAWILRTDSEVRTDRLQLKDLDSRIELAERIRSLQPEGAEHDGDVPAERRIEAVRVKTADPDIDDLLDSMYEQREGLVRRGVKRPPDVRTMAEQADYGVGYLDFAFKSESRTHFRILGLEPFLLDRGEGDDWVVDSGGPRTQLEDPPYETAALWLLVALKEAALAFPKPLPWIGRIEEIEARLLRGIDGAE